MKTLEQATNDTLDRLGDLDQDIWSREEIELYLQDASDQFTRRTKCIYDIVVIENSPLPSNYHTDLERAHLEARPGSLISDMSFQRTGDERQGVGKRVGSGYGPGSNFSQDFITAGTSADDVPTTIPGGMLPTNTIDVLRVAYNLITLRGMSSMQMREIDNVYELRSGDPQWFVWDKDGLFFLRVVPAATGEADYEDYSGSWGTRTGSDDFTDGTVTVDTSETGGYGILRMQTGYFPAGGPWGTPTRVHPDTMNIKVEVSRLGRKLSGAGSFIEVPDSHYKYLLYWAMQRALRRQGDGQDIALADHYAERFEMGVSRMIEKKAEMNSERRGRFGRTLDKPWLGWPQAPYPYGKPF